MLVMSQPPFLRQDVCNRLEEFSPWGISVEDASLVTVRYLGSELGDQPKFNFSFKDQLKTFYTPV